MDMVPAVDRRASNFIKEVGVPAVMALLMFWLCFRTIDKFDEVTRAVNNNTNVMERVLIKLDGIRR